MNLSEAWVDFLAGFASGAVSVLTCQPVDTVLTRFQASSSSHNLALQETRGLIHTSGVRSLWRGSSVMISAVPMQNSLLMGGYGVGKKWAEGTEASQAGVLRSVFVGGCCGGFLQSFLMSPVELMKVNQQVIGKSTKDAGAELVHGLANSKKSWRGLNATLLRDGIPHGVWFASYEWCKTAMTDALVGTEKSASSSTHEQFTIPLASGAFAASTAWGVGYPADIIKTRIQATQSTKGIYQTAVELVQEANGRVITGLYRGFGLKLARSVPASMIGFTTYEFVAARFR